MKRMQGYQFRLEPKPSQVDHLSQSLGANRFVWNKLLAMNLFRLEQRQPLLWYQEMAWWITLWKQSEEYGFLSDAPAQSLQQTAKALDRAFKDAFDKNQPNKRPPNFKRLGKNEAGIHYPQGFALDQGNAVIKLPKTRWVKYRNSRNIEGTVKNVTVSRKAGKYTVSIQTEREVVQPYHPATSAVGGDFTLCHSVRRQGDRSHQQLQEAGKEVGHGSTQVEAQDQVLCQLAETEAANQPYSQHHSQCAY